MKFKWILDKHNGWMKFGGTCLTLEKNATNDFLLSFKVCDAGASSQRWHFKKFQDNAGN